MESKVNVQSLKRLRERNPQNALAKKIPTITDHYKSGGPLSRLIKSHFNWEGRASRDLREILAAGILPDEGESEVGKTRKLY